MTIKEQYGLKFTKIHSQGYSKFYSCDANTLIEGSMCLAILLQSISDRESSGMLEEVENAISGINFEENYILDADPSVWINFYPPNAEIFYAGGIYSFLILLTDLKQLLEEWIGFINGNS